MCSECCIISIYSIWQILIFKATYIALKVHVPSVLVIEHVTLVLLVLYCSTALLVSGYIDAISWQWHQVINFCYSYFCFDSLMHGILHLYVSPRHIEL